jgi:hypothetical protein
MREACPPRTDLIQEGLLTPMRRRMHVSYEEEDTCVRGAGRFVEFASYFVHERNSCSNDTYHLHHMYPPPHMTHASSKRDLLMTHTISTSSKNGPECSSEVGRERGHMYPPPYMTLQYEANKCSWARYASHIYYRERY